MANGGALSPPPVSNVHRDAASRRHAGASENCTPRALLLGPVFSPGTGGGLVVALDDLCLALRQWGWIIEHPSFGAGRVSGGSAAPYPEPWPLGGGRGSAAVIRLQSRLPTRLRRWAINLSRAPRFFERASAILAAADAQLRHGEYDVVLVCSALQQPPGLLRLATSLHPCVVAISLTALPDEFRYKWLWATMRAVARTRTRGICHSSLGRPVEPNALRHAVFASTAWRGAALRAGLSPERTSTIYFGVEVPPSTVRGAWGDRLLWVGRLSPEKGLHDLLRALPTVRARLPAITLTAIGARGPSSYDRLIRDRLCADNASSVSLLGARPRSELQDAYRDHDALVFYSIFDEPVALVVLEAFGAGLPVIATRPRTREGPLREEETCLCFDPTDPESLARAVERLRGDEALRARLTRRAREVVVREFSLDRMGATYDVLLRQLVDSRR